MPNRTAKLFNDPHENRYVNRKYVLKLVTIILKTSSVKNMERQLENSVRNGDIEVVVLWHITIDRTLSGYRMRRHAKC